MRQSRWPLGGDATGNRRCLALLALVVTGGFWVTITQFIIKYEWVGGCPLSNWLG